VVNLPTTHIDWPGARRIIRSIFPPIDLFEDIADPSDWLLLISAEQKTNPRLMAAIGNLDLVPPARRVSGPGASWLMAPFTHASPDRPSRFSDGTFGVLYVAQDVRTALLETVHHHGRFMAATRQAPGWTSDFRELMLTIDATLHDLRGTSHPALAPDDYSMSQALGSTLRSGGSEGIAYPSQRDAGGECTALFYPDLARDVRQGRHLSYHWDGARVDLLRDTGSGEIWRLQE
jgi:RES domain-containing protein